MQSTPRSRTMWLLLRCMEEWQVLPENPHDLVQWFAERLGVADQLESGALGC